MPCFFNGIFGHKTSRGLYSRKWFIKEGDESSNEVLYFLITFNNFLGIVSNEGQYPNPHHEEQDRLLSLGPMCKNPFDLMPMLRVLAGKNISMLNLDSKVDISKLKVSTIRFPVQCESLQCITIKFNTLLCFYSFTTWKMTVGNSYSVQ